MASLKAFFNKLAGYLPFNNSLGARWGILGFIVLVCLVLSARCAKADELDVNIGSEVVHGNGASIGLYYFHNLPLGLGNSSPLRVWFGTSMFASDGLGDQSNWAWSTGLESNLGYLHAGIGASYLARVDSLNGQHANYRLYLSYNRWKVCHIYVEHYSDAGTSSPNVGRNIIGCSWQLR